MRGFRELKLGLRIRDRWDFLGVLLLMASSIPVVLLVPGTLLVVDRPNLLDGSWILDTSFKASRGIWLGRDVAFTYGPLYQWLSSAPARWLGPSIGTIEATSNTLPLWCTFVFAWLTLFLLMPEARPWKRFVLLLLLCLCWSPYDIRIFSAILLFGLFLRGWYALTADRLQPWLFGSAAAMLCAAAFLISADTGIFAILALATSFAGAFPARRPCMLALLAFAFASVILTIVVNAFMASPLDFRFWKTSLAIVSGYRWMEPAGMTKAGKIHLLAALGAGIIVFFTRLAGTRGSETTLTSRPSFLLAGFAFAFLALQSGLVRSDMGHITLAIFPMVCFTGAVLFSLQSRAATAIGVLAFFALSWFVIRPNPDFLPSNVAARYAQIHQPLLDCPSGWEQFSGACFQPPFAAMLQTTGKFLQQNSSERESVVIFPYQTAFGIVSGRNVAGGLMQTYLASGPYLSHVEIDALERSAAPSGLYLPEGMLSIPIDGVPNFTRSPEVWMWIRDHYRADGPTAPGTLGLVREENPKATRQISQTLGLQPQTWPIHTRSTLLDLGSTAWPADGADFLCLRLNVRYPFWWRLRKPQRMQLEITRSDGTHDLKSFIVPPNVSSRAWFFPWSEPDLANYFSRDEGQWRAGPRPAVIHLRLWVTPLDWMSQVPESVTLESAEAVRLGVSQ